jgi:hypothetical protein
MINFFINLIIGWYYMGIIFVIVFGTFLATIVLFVHNQKAYSKPLPSIIRLIVCNRFVSTILVAPSASLTELWMEYGYMKNKEKYAGDRFASKNRTGDPVSTECIKTGI